VDRDIGYARDDADAWADECAEIGDLARYVEAHLDHGDLVARFDPEKGERTPISLLNDDTVRRTR